jgi:hypothetical protein
VDEPTLWKNFLVDPYDAEEIEAALRSQGCFPSAAGSMPFAAVENEGGAFAQPFGRASRRASLTEEQHGQSVSQDLSNVAAALQAVAARENKATVIQTSAPDPEVGMSIAVLKSELEQLRRESVMHQNALAEMQKEEAILKDKVLSKRKSVDMPLPPGWEAKIDKVSQKTYYVNRTSREKTWRRPKPLPQDEDKDGDGILDSDQNPDGTLTEEAKARYRAEGRKFEEPEPAAAADKKDKGVKESKSGDTDAKAKDKDKKDKEKEKEKSKSSKDKDKDKEKDKEKEKEKDKERPRPRSSRSKPDP